VVKYSLLVLAAVLVLAAGAAGVFAYTRWQASQDIKGSSTEEFVTTEVFHPRPSRDPIRWPTYGYDNERRRVDEGLGLEPPFRAVWTFKAKKLVEFPPVLGYRRLFAETNDGRILSIDRRFGTLHWSAPFGRCAAASPALADYTVYAVFLNKPPCNASGDHLDGLVVALRERDGKERWRFSLGPSETSPLIAEERVYVGDWRGNVYALDQDTGKVVWHEKVGGAVKGAIAYSSGRIFFGSYDHHVYSLNAKTGKQVWQGTAQERLGPQGTFYSTPAVSYGRVYIGSTDGKVYSFGASTGKLRWSQGTGSYVYSSPAVWRKLVLIGSHDKHFYALDAATGEERWKFDAKGKISGSATVIDGVVYFSTLAQRTYALDAASGKLLWTYNDGKYAGVIGGRERLYLTGHTRIYAMLHRVGPGK
jgi:outer membrane protein assembly factor BamB